MNWVSKAQYLERRIKKLEATLKLLTDHMQVDEDGNIVIEANKFDISANNDIKIKSFSNINIDADNNISIITNNDDISLFANNNLYITGDNKIVSTSSSYPINVECNGCIITSNENVIIQTNKSIELQPTDRLTSTKALEVVE